MLRRRAPRWWEALHCLRDVSSPKYVHQLPLMDVNCFPDAPRYAMRHVALPAITDGIWHVYSSPAAHLFGGRSAMLRASSWTSHIFSHPQRRTTGETGCSHAGQEQGSPAVVEGSGSGGRGVRSAAPELGRSAVPAGASERADGGAAQAGCSDAGGAAEVQAAGGDGAAAASCRGAEDPPPQQEGRERDGDPGSRWEGCDADGDLLHGSCEKPKHLFKLFIAGCLQSDHNQTFCD